MMKIQKFTGNKKYSLWVAILGFSALVALAINTTEIASHVVIADQSDVASTHLEAGTANYTLMGFSSIPVVLEVSSPLNPSILVGAQPLGSTAPYGAYLGVQGPVDLYAAGEQAITEITALQGL